MTTPLPTVSTPSLGDSMNHPAMPLVLGGCVIAASIGIGIVAPDDYGTPICPSAAYFGVDCPLCGGTRAVGQFMRGNVMAALDHNVLVGVWLPVAIVGWIYWTIASLRGRSIKWPSMSVRQGIALVVFLVAFTVVRNLDVAEWTRWLAANRYQ